MRLGFNPLSAAGAVIGALPEIGAGRKQADIVTGPLPGLQNRLTELVIGMQEGRLTDYASVARELAQIESWWRSNVLSQISDPRVAPTANGFLFDPEFLGGVAWARKVMAEESARRSAAAMVPAAPLAPVPGTWGGGQLFDEDASFVGPSYLPQSRPPSWTEVLPELLAPVWPRPAVPVDAVQARPQIPEWVPLAALGVGAYFLFFK